MQAEVEKKTMLTKIEQKKLPNRLATSWAVTFGLRLLKSERLIDAFLLGLVYGVIAVQNLAVDWEFDSMNFC
jgi:hypothetical protein